MQWHLRDLPGIDKPRQEIETSFLDYGLDQSITQT